MAVIDDLVEESLKKFIGEDLYNELLECLDFLDYERELDFRGKCYTVRELYQLYKLVRILILSFAHNLAVLGEAARGAEIQEEFSLDDYLTKLGEEIDRENFR